MKKILKLLFLIVTMILVSQYIIDRLFPLKYYEEVMAASKKYSIPPEIIFSIAKAESNFREKAVSPKGAVGVMQVMPSTAKWYLETKNEKYKKENLYNYRENINIGAGYFKYLYNDFGDYSESLAAYNAGPNRVKERGWHNIKETRKYVKKVKLYIKIYKIVLKQKEIKIKLFDKLKRIIVIDN